MKNDSKRAIDFIQSINNQIKSKSQVNLNKGKDDDSPSNTDAPYINGGTGELASTTNRAKLWVPEVEVTTVSKNNSHILSTQRSRMQNHAALHLQALTNATALKSSAGQRPSSRSKKINDASSSHRELVKPYRKK